MKPGTRQHGPATLRLSFNTSVPAHLRGGLLEVSHVHTEPGQRRHGCASLLLQRVCAEADAAGKVLMLMPRPFGEVGPDADALAEWYARLGFVAIQQQPLIMARQPGADIRVRMTPVARALEVH